jgi:hypothetical protein
MFPFDNIRIHISICSIKSGFIPSSRTLVGRICVPNMGFPFGGNFTSNLGYQMHICFNPHGGNVPGTNYMSGNMRHGGMSGSFHDNTETISTTQLPLFATLNLYNIYRLTNDLMHDNLTQPPIPTKLPLEIPKFEDKVGEYLLNNVMEFHL